MILLEASTGGTVAITVVAFLIITLLLVGLLLVVKQKLSPSGPVTITINGERKIEVASGDSLLTTLSAQKYSYHQLVVEEEPVSSVNAM